MVFNLLLPSITKLLCFYFVPFAIPVVIETKKLKPAPAIPTDVPITLVNEAIETLPPVADKAIKDLSKQSKAETYLLSLLLTDSLSRISAIEYSLISLILFSLISI